MKYFKCNECKKTNRDNRCFSVILSTDEPEFCVIDSQDNAEWEEITVNVFIKLTSK